MYSTKYDLMIRDMALVQCHPHVNGSDFNEALLVADFELAEAMSRNLRESTVLRHEENTAQN